MRLVLNRLEKAFVVFVLLFATSPFTHVLGRGSDAGEGNPLTQAVWLGVYAITLMLILPRLNRFAYVASRDALILFLVGLAIFSALWSGRPEVTFRLAVALGATMIFAAYLATRFDMQEQLHLLAWTLGLITILSLIVILVWPEYGIMQIGNRTGALRGIYQQKGPLGRYMALAVVVFYLLARSESRHRWLFWGFLSLTIGLLLFSSSRNPTISLILVLLTLAVYKVLWRRWPVTLAVPLVIVATLTTIGLATIVIVQADFFLGLLDRSSTLTGRTDLWAILFDLAGERPILGYGFRGFWFGLDGPSAQVWRILDWPVRHAHNGFLEIMLALGLVGLLVFLLNYILVFFKAVRWTRLNRTFDSLWPIAFLTFILLANLTSTAFLSQNSLLWILYISVSLTISVRYRKRKNPNELEGHVLPKQMRVKDFAPEANSAQ